MKVLLCLMIVILISVTAMGEGLDSLKTQAGVYSIPIVGTTAISYTRMEPMGGQYGVPGTVEIKATGTGINGTDSIAFYAWLEYTMDGIQFFNPYGITFSGVTDTLTWGVEISPSWGWNGFRGAFKGNPGIDLSTGITAKWKISKIKRASK